LGMLHRQHHRLPQCRPPNFSSASPDHRINRI
jgi:hypothetical protein